MIPRPALTHAWPRLTSPRAHAAQGMGAPLRLPPAGAARAGCQGAQPRAPRPPAHPLQGRGLRAPGPAVEQGKHERPLRTQPPALAAAQRRSTACRLPSRPPAARCLLGRAAQWVACKASHVCVGASSAFGGRQQQPGGANQRVRRWWEGPHTDGSRTHTCL